MTITMFGSEMANLVPNFYSRAKNKSILAQKTANLRDIDPPILRRGPQMVTANLREPPTSNPPIARTYCIMLSQQ